MGPIAQTGEQDWAESQATGLCRLSPYAKTRVGFLNLGCLRLDNSLL